MKAKPGWLLVEGCYSLWFLKGFSKSEVVAEEGMHGFFAYLKQRLKSPSFYFKPPE